MKPIPAPIDDKRSAAFDAIVGTADASIIASAIRAYADDALNGYGHTGVRRPNRSDLVSNVVNAVMPDVTNGLRSSAWNSADLVRSLIREVSREQRRFKAFLLLRKHYKNTVRTAIFRILRTRPVSHIGAIPAKRAAATPPQRLARLVDELTMGAFFVVYKTWDDRAPMASALYLDEETREKADAASANAFPADGPPHSHRAKLERQAREAAEVAALMLGHNAGDPFAYDAIYRRFTPTLRATIVALGGASSVETAVQDAWIRLARLRLDPFRANTFRGYTRKAAASALYEEWRWAGRLPTIRTKLAAQPPRTVTLCPEPSLNLTLLAALFDGTTPPHQALTFGFVKFLMRPRHIPAKLAHKPLQTLLCAFIWMYSAKHGGNPPRRALREICGPARKALRKPLADLLDENGKRTFPHLLDKIAGSTTLPDYANGDPVRLPKLLHQWAGTVTERMRRRFRHP